MGEAQTNLLMFTLYAFCRQVGPWPLSCVHAGGCLPCVSVKLLPIICDCSMSIANCLLIVLSCCKFAVGELTALLGEEQTILPLVPSLSTG